MSVLSVQKARRLSLGDLLVDDVFPGFKLGEFAVLHGNAASLMSFVLSVRCQMPVEEGGLDSPVIFVDGGNSFNPYLVAEIARSYGLDPKLALERIYVSRAFTTYQLCSLILEKFETFLVKKGAKLLMVSDLASLFFDKNMPPTEARNLFTKACAKLSETAVSQKILVIASYFPVRKHRQGLLFDAVLFGKSTVSVKFKKTERTLSLILEDYPRTKSISLDFSEDYHPLRFSAEA